MLSRAHGPSLDPLRPGQLVQRLGSRILHAFFGILKEINERPGCPCVSDPPQRPCGCFAYLSILVLQGHGQRFYDLLPMICFRQVLPDLAQSPDGSKPESRVWI